MAGRGIPGFLGVVLAIFVGSLAAAQDAGVCGGKQTPVRILEAVDATTLRLADGRLVHLANVIAPLAIDGDTQAPAHAKNLLAVIVNGKDVTLFITSEAKDRYGRISAQAILIEGKRWLEAELLERGIARVFLVADDKCAKALLQYEAKARAAKRGLWSDARFAVFDASGIESLLAAEGRFVVVEGTILRVGEARGRIYLDFGRRFTEDFTIVVSDGVRKALITQGSDPKSWRGKRIRVRGIVFSWGGPAIELHTAQAIELLDRELPKTE